MKKELKIIEGNFNTGEVMLENGYKNVLLTNKIIVDSIGVVDVRLLITVDIEEPKSKELLRIFSAEIEGSGFVAWFPLNNDQGCFTSNNFGLDQDLSVAFCRKLISLYGLKSLIGTTIDIRQPEAA